MKRAKMNEDLQVLCRGRLRIMHIKSLEEIWQIIEEVPGTMLVLDLSSMDSEQQQRAIDILSGSLYVNEGCMERVIESVFVCIPSSVAFVEQEIKMIEETAV